MDLMNLTAEDVALVEARMTDFTRSDERFHGQELRRINEAVGRFVDESNGSSNSAEWRASVLWDFSGTMCTPMEYPTDTVFPTWESVRSVFEEDFQRAQQDHQEWSETDPEAFRKSQGWHGESGDPVPHPWGPDAIALCRAWLTSTPYEVWWVMDQVRIQVEFEVQDKLASMAGGYDNGSSVATLASEHFARTLMKVREHLSVRIDVMGRMATVDGALQSNPLGERNG